MIETKINLDFDGVLDLGRAGETEARCFIFDLYGWMDHFNAGGRVHLLARRPWETESYPCVLTVDGNKAVWIVRNADVALPGNGSVELQYSVGDSVVLSSVWRTHIGESLVAAAGDPPKPQTPWVQEVLQSAEKSAKAAADAEIAAEQAQRAVEDLQPKAEVVDDVLFLTGCGPVTAEVVDDVLYLKEGTA